MKHHYLREKKFCKNLNMEETTSANYQYLKNICKYFNMKILGEYQDSYALHNTLLLTDVFQIFWNKYIEIAKLDSIYFLSMAGLS